MEVIFMESWDHHTTSELTKKWNAQIGPDSLFVPPTITTTAGRRGKGLDANTGGSAWKSFADLSSFSLGFAFRPMDIANKRIAALRDEETIQLYIQLSSLGKVQVFRGNGGLIGTSAQTLNAATYYHIELGGIISSINGSVTLHINGKLALGFAVSPVNTQVSSSARINIATFGDPSTSTIHFHYDDIFMTDGQMIGPQFVDVLRPNGGAPHLMDMSVVGAGSHYQAVDDTVPDDDSSYVYSSSSNRGTFLSEFEDIRQPLPSNAPPMSGAIYGIGVHTYSRKEYGNTRAFQTGLYPGTQDGAPGSIAYFNNDPLYVETEYAYHSDYYSNNPGSGGTWTVGSINALKAGVARVI